MKRMLPIRLSGLLRITLAVSLTSSALTAQETTADSSKTPQNDQTQVKKPKSSGEEPTSNSVGEDAGSYTVISSIEFGYRGISMDGDVNKYKSDLNYKAGPRVFDASFLLRSKNEKASFFDTLLVTSTGWGADPSGSLRINVENPKWYRFDGSYRRFKYYRFLNNLANPVWLFTPVPLQPNPLTGLHGVDTKTQLGDFDLTILPKNRRLKFYAGFSPERYDGLAFSSARGGGNEYQIPIQVRSRANDFRFGADASLGPVDFSFMQGFRRFREDNVTESARGLNTNTGTSVAQLTFYNRQEPARGSVDYTRFSVHTLIARRLDLTARIVHSEATSNFIFVENFRGRNYNPRISGWPPTPPGGTPNTLNLGQFNITGDTKRPNTLFDIGATLLATKRFRLSNTFRVEDFKITGFALFADFFSITRNLTGGSTRTDTIGFSNLDATEVTKFRKYQNTIEGDYDFGRRASVHFGYRYANREVERFFDGFNLASAGSVTTPPARTTHVEIFENNTRAFFGGFKARPYRNWTLYLDAERGTADNVFTRIGNYNYTNVRFKSRYAPNRKVNFNLSVITRNNSNPSEIAGISIEDFGVTHKSRVFTSSLDWLATPRLSFNFGYNYNWVNSNAVIDFSYLSTSNSAIRGNALYYMRNNFFYAESTARLSSRVTFYSAYRINKDNGQGNRVSDPLITGARALITSYPMSFQSPEARLAIKLHRRLDWNVGYQYYNYNESVLVGPRPQNYHTHLPYTSLRLYFGRVE